MQRKKSAATLTAGGALLARLKTLGVDVLFANSGTDFPPIIEGIAEAAQRKLELPDALVIPHEHAAMGMAYGYYLATGRPQAVMAHTNVGLANCVIGAINAAAARIPVLMLSGRTPATERGRFGSRTIPIGWGQEMRDQTALVRETTKWDYELRFPEQIVELADRAYAIAGSTPRGPVYMSLPREVLCEPCPLDELARPIQMSAVRTSPDPSAIARAAEILAAAERPVICAQRGAGSPEGFAALARLVETWGIPVVQFWANELAVPTGHPMYAGVDPGPLLAEADAVLVIDSLAPWSPDVHMPPPSCPVIHLGPDPLFERFPVRNFRCDLALAGDTADGILALAEAMAKRAAPYAKRNAARRERHGAANAKRRKSAIAMMEAAPVMTKARLGRALSRALDGADATIFSELGVPLDAMELPRHGCWYQEPHSGGLGWSFPAALGMKLADRERMVVATMGDGSYIFANPTACHQIAEALELPILAVIVNNGEWGAVRNAVLGLYPEGAAAKANVMPLTSLAPSPDFVQVAQASRAWARRVDDPSEVENALREAIAHVRTQKSMALVDVKVAP